MENSTPMIEPLDDVLHSLRLSVIHAPDIGPTTLHEGDFVLLARGAGHTIADAMASSVMPYEDIAPEFLSDRYAQFGYGAGDPGTRLICMFVRFEDPTAQRLIERNAGGALNRNSTSISPLRRVPARRVQRNSAAGSAATAMGIRE